MPRGRSAAVTIAACYASPEGVVPEGDNTATYYTNNAPHHYNNARKMFEVGDRSTLGVVTCGLGDLLMNSYRRLFFNLDDQFSRATVKLFAEVTTVWIDLFWEESTSSQIITDFQALACKAMSDPNTNPGQIAVKPTAIMCSKYDQ